MFNYRRWIGGVERDFSGQARFPKVGVLLVVNVGNFIFEQLSKKIKI